MISVGGGKGGEAGPGWPYPPRRPPTPSPPTSFPANLHPPQPPSRPTSSPPSPRLPPSPPYFTAAWPMAAAISASLRRGLCWCTKGGRSRGPAETAAADEVAAAEPADGGQAGSRPRWRRRRWWWQRLLRRPRPADRPRRSVAFLPSRKSQLILAPSEGRACASYVCGVHVLYIRTVHIYVDTSSQCDGEAHRGSPSPRPGGARRPRAGRAPARRHGSCPLPLKTATQRGWGVGSS